MKHTLSVKMKDLLVPEDALVALKTMLRDLGCEAVVSLTSKNDHFDENGESDTVTRTRIVHPGKPLNVEEFVDPVVQLEMFGSKVVELKPQSTPAA